MAGTDEFERHGGRTFTRIRPVRSYTTLWDVTSLVQLAAGYPAAQSWWETGALADLADIAIEQGDFERARQHAERSLALVIARGRSPARPLMSLGEIALREGELDRAAELLEGAAHGSKESGHEFNYAGALEALGEVARRRGDLDRAVELFTEALRRWAALGDPACVAECLQDLALVSHERGETDRAGMLWGAGLALREHWVFGRHRTEPPVSTEAKAAGAAMTFEEVVELALASLD